MDLGIPEAIRKVVRKIVPDFMLERRRQRWLRRQQDHRLHIVREFHKLYYPTLTHEAFWLGVPALKCPLDCWVYQEIIFRTRPEIIIETGVCYGGSTLYMASILDLVGSGSIIAIDIDLSQVHEKVRNHPRVTLMEGSSVDATILQEVKKKSNGKKTMVVLDSDHRAQHVLNELNSYSDMVSSGCYLICEDTNLNGNPVFSAVPYNPGPHEAMEEFIKLNGDRWEVDYGSEKYLLTFNPGGFLFKK
jgi:cephalosporin hydroxylase